MTNIQSTSKDMLISENTSIAYLIKQEPLALEVIISLAPGFSKLRNPIIRKLMAGRTSISMAAHIGGCEIDAFFDKLSPLGFRTANSPKSMPSVVKHFEPSCEAIIYPKSLIVELDVRPLLTQGIDPLLSIMKQVSLLKADEALSIINSFIPTPLIHVLAKKGYSHHIQKVNDGHYITTFIPNKVTDYSIGDTKTTDVSVFINKLASYKTKYRELDVRHLEMPLPMTAILENLFDLPGDHVLYVHHKKYPVFLVPELKEKGFEMMHIEQQDGVDLLIYKHEIA